MDDKLILAINPGSTSTKIALFQGNKEMFLKNVKHSSEELDKFAKITDQFEFRKNVILYEIENSGFNITDIGTIVGRGGIVKPVKCGVYRINKALLKDLKKGVLGEHASNLGGLIANDISRSIKGSKAFIADPVVVDELDDIARVSGHPKLERVSIFHALNQKAMARQHAKSISQNYEDLNLIVVHLGGGISVGAHRRGRVVDVNQAIDGEGPFSPERSGTLPVGALAKLCFSGEVTHEEVKKMITGQGGYVAYLGTNNAHEVEKRAEQGDKKAKFIQEALAYQVAKEIGAMSTVLKGDVDGIILTGGMAYGKSLIDSITERVRHISFVYVYPGEDEMRALAKNALMALKGEVEIFEYK